MIGNHGCLNRAVRENVAGHYRLDSFSVKLTLIAMTLSNSRPWHQNFCENIPVTCEEKNGARGKHGSKRKYIKIPYY